MTPSRGYLLYFEAPQGREGVFSQQEKEVLAQINQKVAAADSLPEILEFLFSESGEIFSGDRLGLAFLEEEGKRAKAHWSCAAYRPLLLQQGYSEDLSGSSLAEILSSGRLRIIADLEQYLQDHPRSVSTKLLVKEGVRSSLTCPLRVEGRPVGFFFRSSRRPDAFDRHQALLQMAIAERLSQAVEKAWRIEQLQEANRAYLELLGFVSHELKSPLASIVTDVRLLADGYLGPLPAEPLRKAKRMQVKAEYLLTLVREYLDLARLEGGALSPNVQGGADWVADVIEPALEIVAPQIEAAKMAVHKQYPPHLPAEVDVELAKIVLVNLLSNAAKYGREGGKIEIAATADGGGLRCSVTNEGPGFAAEERGALFRKFSRLKAPELARRKGTGVGLYTCWRIATLHGGKMSADSQPGAWARFAIEIPQPPRLPTAALEG